MLDELHVHQIELEMQNEELRRTQVELDASRARYFDLYDLAPVGYCTLNEQGFILEANLTVANLLGVSRGVVVKQPISRFIFKEDQDIYYLHRKQLFETGEVRACEVRLVKSDGVAFWVRMETNIVRNADGGPASRVVLSDITGRKRAEEALRGMMEDLDRSNKDLQQFASIASHDLQEPLRMVGSYAQLLAKRYESRLDEKAKEYIAYVVEGAVRMQRLVNDLLTYSRVGTHGNPMEARDSHVILGEAIMNLAILIEESKAIVTVDALPIVCADASQLVQVFQNLLANAIKFRSEEIPRIHVFARDAGHEWVFSVRDNGIGIDRQYAERIFVIFQRLHTREEYPGSGIGLAVCKRIVERHGGRIWLESEPGKGSTFFFTISKLETGAMR
jgi:PAS domain S-box-containing protein